MSVDISLKELAIITTRDNARSIGGTRQNRAGMDANAAFAGQQQRLLAEHKYGRCAKKMHADDRRVHVEAADAIGQ